MLRREQHRKGFSSANHTNLGRRLQQGTLLQFYAKAAISPKKAMLKVGFIR
jgi:hypothetical protein